MAGLFKIHPENGSTITCSLTNDDNETYIISTYDFKEAEREKVLYSEGLSGGKVNGIDYGDVEIDLRIIIAGDTWEEIAAAQRTLSRAFRDKDGGYIEFRPAEFDSSVMSTWYRYLRSSPPKSTGKNNKPVVSNYKLAQLFEYKVMIKAWATSDPDSLTHLGQTVQTSITDSLGISSSSLKGDISLLHAKITCHTATAIGANSSNNVIIAVSEVDNYTDPVPGLVEAEDGTPQTGYQCGTWSIVSNSSFSGGQYYELTNPDNTNSIAFDIFNDMNISSTHFGMFNVLFGYNINSSGGTWSTSIRISAWSDESIDITQSDSILAVNYDFHSVALPPFSAKEEMINNDTMSVNVYFDLTGGTPSTAEIDFDFLWFIPQDSIVAHISTYTVTDFGYNSDYHRYLIVSAVDGSAYITTDRVGGVDITERIEGGVSWKKGTPPESFIIDSDKNYNVAILPLEGTENQYTEGTTLLTFDMYCTFGTIYPFEVA